MQIYGNRKQCGNHIIKYYELQGSIQNKEGQALHFSEFMQMLIKIEKKTKKVLCQNVNHLYTYFNVARLSLIKQKQSILRRAQQLKNYLQNKKEQIFKGEL
ncbi:unnamed protein product [Paramecium sonneborni]|uniref:Uncharacterized protein n=1 Tax=Paramecium sonneborni TaxID=65129 RepID=A0A8S1RSZ6_9CILI|nr:unnamed protein product [Paramecium sonneborni]